MSDIEPYRLLRSLGIFLPDNDRLSLEFLADFHKNFYPTSGYKKKDLVIDQYPGTTDYIIHKNDSKNEMSDTYLPNMEKIKPIITVSCPYLPENVKLWDPRYQEEADKLKIYLEARNTDKNAGDKLFN